MYKYYNHSVLYVLKTRCEKFFSGTLFYFFQVKYFLKKKEKKKSLKKTCYLTICINHWFKGTRKPKSSSSLLTERQIILFFTLSFISLFRKLWTKVEEADIGKPVGNETRSLLPFVDNASVVTSIVYFLNFSSFNFSLSLNFSLTFVRKDTQEFDLYRFRELTK